MLFPDACFDLLPDWPPLPAEAIMSEFLALGFEPGACRDKLEQLIGTLQLDPTWFDLDAVATGGRTGTDKLLFDLYQGQRERAWRWQMHSPLRRSFTLPLKAEEVEVASEIVRLGTQGESLGEFRDECDGALGSTLASWLLPSTLTELPHGQHGLWPRLEGPGIYRREHASLIFRSRTTTLVTDPQGYNRAWTTNGGRFPGESAPLPLDGVLLTHSHGDHWHLPSILRMVPSNEVPVIVPHVPRPSLLCPEDMGESLRLTGQNASDPAWWSTVEIGDFVIDVLPFYGEQPLRERSGLAADLRNWGNCYRFTCPEYSAAILVDSGTDPLGNMVDVLERSVAERGPLDVLLSCCFSFPEGYNPGLPIYFLTVPMEHLRHFYLHPTARRSMTLGIDGLVSACKAARCRYFLPYAHGFTGLFRSPRSAEGGRQAEEEALAAIGSGLGENSSTKILSWHPGDMARVEGGELTILREGQPR